MSWQMAVLSRWLRLTTRPVAARTRNWKAARRMFSVAAWIGFRRAPGCRETAAEAELAPGLWVVSDDAPPRGVILFLHGGAYMVGSPWIYRDLAGRLASSSGCAVYLPDYPLAPEHPAPAAFDAAVRVWGALLAEGRRPSDIVIAGDSAGGGLALALLSHLLAAGQRPACCVTFAPWTDMTLSGASLVANAPSDVVLPAERLEEVRDMVAGSLDHADPRISPLFARFGDCPPVWLSWSEAEILRDDCRRMADALRAQGAHVTCDVQKRAPHVWQLFQRSLPEADASLDRAAAFIRESFQPNR